MASWNEDYTAYELSNPSEVATFTYTKANGFKVQHLGDCDCQLYDRPDGFSPVPLMCKR